MSTAADLALFYQALLHNDAGIWTADALQRFTAELRTNLPDSAGIPVNRTLGLIVAGDDGQGVFRGFGRSASAGAFGHPGAGGQLAWADPDSGLSFASLTNGRERNMLLEWRRWTSISTRAGQAVTPV